MFTQVYKYKIDKGDYQPKIFLIISFTILHKWLKATPMQAEAVYTVVPMITLAMLMLEDSRLSTAS